jgi:hypothetical protein
MRASECAGARAMEKIFMTTDGSEETIVLF